jgi:hypothetical protein
MSRSLSWTAVFAVLVLAGLLRAADAAPSGEWPVEVKPAATNKLKGTMQAYPDVIIIKDNKMTTQVSAKYGYESGVCTVKTEGGKSVITAELKHPKHGNNTYTVEIKGAAITGTMKWGKTGEDGKAKSADYTLASAAK